ncbi:MAG: hypothetical protein K0R24_276 [Gammaproteobacteria bacterium]|jgi:type II secretory pathway pseudopilin PulG|nr:hypothetical protein [Gammaproteobacteria bacterium]
MAKPFRKLQGITLIEAMLVLAIVIAIILFSIRQYTQYERERNIQLLAYHIDIVFQAMRNYYYANCANLITPTLAPTDSYTPPNPFPISIITDLESYIDEHWQGINPSIDTSFGESGYTVQFNRMISTQARQENFCYYFAGQPQSCAALPNNNAELYLWVAQIVVKIRNPAMTLAYKGMLNASCAIANFSPDTATVVDCKTEGVTSGAPAYLVWQKLPSFVSPKMNSSLWAIMPYIKEFNLQYTHDRQAELISTDYAGSKYYLCGG